MTRVKKAVHALKTRRKILRQAKGYRFARSKKERAANEALVHAGSYAFAHRRDKKGDFRRLWTVRLNAHLRALGLSYSKFMGTVKKKKIGLDRKILATLAETKPETFRKIVEKVS
ncbi:50S ribosomal protein L20 [Patescibacteria group bacterium]|nr:MAG: 50S ribosomal protein L20 [Patescibacteria group bacterium]